MTEEWHQSLDTTGISELRQSARDTESKVFVIRLQETQQGYDGLLVADFA